MSLLRLEKINTQNLWIFLVFFISGWAAILYQLIWQRFLFTVFGSNIESTTIIVSAFMFGLGVGSLVGGQVSVKYRQHLLLAFSIVELLIGVFGFFSLEIFGFFSSITLHSGSVTTSLISLLLVIFPTLLMGSTLPLLVQQFINTNEGNVGKTLGEFYFVNTLGSAIGSLIAAKYIFKLFLMNGSILFAVALNFTAAVTVLYYYFNFKKAHEK